MLPHDDMGAGPAVVLLHAGVADRGMWAEHLAALADAGFRAVALDLPGFGEAPVAEGEQAPWADVLAAMDALAIDSAALVGNSFGAAVALRVAVVAPERVGALVLVSTPAPGIEPSAELEAAWQAEEAALERGDIDGAVRAVVEAWTLPDSTPALRERVAAMQRRAFELQRDAGPISEAPDPLEEHPKALADIAVPALVAAGESDLQDFRAGAEALAQALPRSRSATIEGAGHLAPLEAPARFRELLLEFLREQHPPS
jgi:pimeloyl-ACP methyl ester carboxylesterase